MSIIRINFLIDPLVLLERYGSTGNTSQCLPIKYHTVIPTVLKVYLTSLNNMNKMNIKLI